MRCIGYIQHCVLITCRAKALIKATVISITKLCFVYVIAIYCVRNHNEVVYGITAESCMLSHVSRVCISCLQEKKRAEALFLVCSMLAATPSPNLALEWSDF